MLFIPVLLSCGLIVKALLSTISFDEQTNQEYLVAGNQDPETGSQQDVAPLDPSKYKTYFVGGELNASFYLDDLNDIVKNVLRRGQYWEAHIGRIIRKYTKPNSIAVDLGAHIGVHTTAMSRAVGPEGKVYAFEPQKKLFAENLANLKLNFRLARFSANNFF